MDKEPQPVRGAGVRVDVSRALTQIIRHRRTIEWVRANRLQWLSTPLHQRLLYGTLRHYLSLEELVASQLRKPLKTKDLDIKHLLLVGAYQLLHTQIAAHATINESVSATKTLGKTWATGLVNAILRNIQRQSKSRPIPEADPRLEHPDWMVDKLTDQYPDRATELMAANSQRAPMSLRINTCATSALDYKNQLESAAIGYSEGPWPEALILDHPQPASDLPGWSRGECAVQDLAAQGAGQIMMQLLSSNAVEEEALQLLDACAAPGGKLFHIKEALTAAGLKHQLYALDNKAKRLDDIAHIGERLGHRTHLHKHTPMSDDRQKIIAEDSIVLGCADASESPLPFTEAFDAILIDAPCSGSGTIRRNPDIRLLLTPDALQQLPLQQHRLVQNLWQHVKPGGTLVYSTCSVFAEENDQVIHSFLVKNKDAHVIPLRLDLDLGRPTEYGLQLLPTNALTDGFYYCALSKMPHPASSL